MASMKPCTQRKLIQGKDGVHEALYSEEIFQGKDVESMKHCIQWKLSRGKM